MPSDHKGGNRMPESRMLLLALCALIVACRGGERRNAVAADTVGARAHAAAMLAPLAPVRALSVVEADYAAQAAQRGFRDDVRNYAQVIGTDHRAVIAILDSVARAQGVGYEATATVRELENAARTVHAGRDSLTGIDYDLAYIRAEVETHRQLIDRLDQELIPGMGAAPQKSVLHDVRAMANAHLARARQILALVLRETPAAAGRPVTTPKPATGAAPRTDTVRRPPSDTGRPRVRPDTLQT
jgi:putative membrane protein